MGPNCGSLCKTVSKFLKYSLARILKQYHNFNAFSEYHLEVLVGTAILLNRKGGRVYRVDLTSRHPKFDESDRVSTAHDIGLLRTSQMIQFDQQVQNIDLAAIDNLNGQLFGIIVGWGKNEVRT